MNITFIEKAKYIGLLNSAPKPAIKYIPDWYKDAPLFVDKEFKTKRCCLINKSPNTTYKNCTPFLDALSTGYIFEAPVDIQFTLSNDGSIVWNSRIGKQDGICAVITLHNLVQHPNLNNLNKNTPHSLVFKFNTGYGIKTPKGYSTLYTQPFNRYDLPFTVYTGVVDTDLYYGEVAFPFQINYNFKEVENDVLIIEKGTPLCQILPYKRDSWKSNIEKFDFDRENKVYLNYFSKIINAYKNRYWTRKKYE